MTELTVQTLREAVGGTAAAFRCVTEYQPAGGAGDKVFPPTYEGGQYATEKRYVAGRRFFGATVGRYANRIANARFSLDDEDVLLAANNGSNALHGGLDGFDRQLWEIADLIDVQVFAGTRMELYQPKIASADELAQEIGAFGEPRGLDRVGLGLDPLEAGRRGYRFYKDKGGCRSSAF